MEEAFFHPAERYYRAAARRQLAAWLLFALLLVTVAASQALRMWRGDDTTPLQLSSELISAEELEARHGLRVWLVGVTAGGGMVDFRLQIADAEKARRLLDDEANWPRLIAADSGEALAPTQEIEDEITLEDGGMLFILFSNRDGLIESGSPVIVQFGDTHLAPVAAQ